MALCLIAMVFSDAVVRPSRSLMYMRSAFGGRRLLIGFQLLFIGIGLTAFLSYAHAWRHAWSSAAWAISFVAIGIIVVHKTERQELRLLCGTQNWVNRLLLLFMLACWFFFSFVCLSGSSIRQLPDEERAASLYNDDAGCAASVLRRVAKQPAVITPSVGGTDERSICTVQWMQVEQKYWSTPSGPPCLDLLDGGRQSLDALTGGRRHHYYCVFSYWELPWWARQYIHRGDMMVAQTAWGKASAFLRPRSAFTDYLFSPRGEYIETMENPDHWFREHVWRSFWAVFLVSFCGRTDLDQPCALVYRCPAVLFSDFLGEFDGSESER